MASEPTPATVISTTVISTTTNHTNEIGFRPIDWWADRDLGIGLERTRRTPPIPAFVRLSRLINADQISASRKADQGPGPDAPLSGNTSEPPAPKPEQTSRKGWADSAGRPLFQIGLAAIVAAVFVGVSTFGRVGDEITTVESPEAAIALDPGSAGSSGPVADPHTPLDPVPGDDEQVREVLEALVRQQSGGGEADLSIVGTTSADQAEVRWTATVRNMGPETAEGPITVVHTVGSNVELVSIAGDGWECENLATSGTITCELDEDLLTGQRRRLGLVTRSAGVEPGTKISGTMSVVATTPDPGLDNNTINVTAISGPTDDREASRSRSTGAAGQSDSDTDAAVGATGASGSKDSDRPGATAMEELPRTGSGLALVLGAAGIVLCFTGRRLMTWSARAQTRTMLTAANIS